MPTPIERKSLKTDLATRYQTQRVGGAFDVKKTLASEIPGRVNDALSMQGTEFQSPAGFEVGFGVNGTQFKDAQGTKSKELSRYIRGIDTTKYKG